MNIIINTNYLKSKNGVLKSLELVFGAICIGIIETCYITPNSLYPTDFFFLIITSSFFICNFIFFVSYLISPLTEFNLPGTILEQNHNFFAAILTIIPSTQLIIKIHLGNKAFFNYEALLVASICGLINTVLYIYSVFSYRGV